MIERQEQDKNKVDEEDHRHHEVVLRELDIQRSEEESQYKPGEPTTSSVF